VFPHDLTDNGGGLAANAVHLSGGRSRNAGYLLMEGMAEPGRDHGGNSRRQSIDGRSNFSANYPGNLAEIGGRIPREADLSEKSALLPIWRLRA
jgi:hypothetical protein